MLLRQTHVYTLCQGYNCIKYLCLPAKCNYVYTYTTQYRKCAVMILIDIIIFISSSDDFNLYRRWVFDCEILLIVNCKFFHNSQSKESQEKNTQLVIYCSLGNSQSLKSQSDLYSAIRNRLTTQSKPDLRYTISISSTALCDSHVLVEL